MSQRSTTKRGRSKFGCETCRVKKVKCDEQRPNCARCCRLKLLCGWPEPEPPLRAKRRGLGSIKFRDNNWVPKEILPALPNRSIVVSHETVSGSTPISGPASDQNTLAPTLLESDEWWESMRLDDESLLWPELSDNAIDAVFPLPYLGYSDPEFQNFEQIPSDVPTEQPEPPEADEIPLSPSRSLSDYHISVPNSLILSEFEHHALNHYQTVFSLYRSTKDPKWSTHKMLLNFGSQDPMIMHFILAVSINDYSIRLANEMAYQEAQIHFEKGSQLWIETMKRDSDTDHLGLMMSFFFLYLYMTKRRNIAPRQLRALSKTVLNFIKKHKLDTRCLGYHSSEHDSHGSTVLAKRRERSLLARLIMWTFDEDVKCGFQGTGGHLAQYLSDHDARTKKIYDASRSVLENHWGQDYPDCQVFDDNENSVILEFLFAMMPLQQDINVLSQRTDANTSDLCHRIQHRFRILEQDYSSVFRIAATRTLPRSRVLVNADYDIVLFNALRIYYFRSTVTDLTMDTPPEIYKALKSLLAIVLQTFTSNGTELHERLQWPLFLVGIETDDLIHREWILSKLTSYRVLEALKSTLKEQHEASKRLTMIEIRKILHKGEESNLLASQTAFLDPILGL